MNIPPSRVLYADGEPLGCVGIGCYLSMGTRGRAESCGEHGDRPGKIFKAVAVPLCISGLQSRYNSVNKVEKKMYLLRRFAERNKRSGECRTP